MSVIQPGKIWLETYEWGERWLSPGWISYDAYGRGTLERLEGPGVMSLDDLIAKTAVYDDAGNFEGHQPRACGDHRTVGSHRAWCFDCSEWCYPNFDAGCIRCRHPEG